MKTEIKVLEKIERTRKKIAALEEKIAALEGKTGAALALEEDVAMQQADAGNVQYEQVIYTTWIEKPEPEPAVGPERQLPLELAAQLREGASQLAFWKLNLNFLYAKYEALVDFFNALCSAHDEFENAAFRERTRLGSGYSDYTFSC